ncbi:MAG: dTDP-4-dehydrorhamnose reductase [Candidatus Eisenbacteria bacterium]|uniref:dTDP-4-dehydrorhamnose reductase n=1 Tax=Eiseniibacteriota bacterium TaxID=2212470 RepID=A0A538T782_UNCEI|nr:MAG: dTDP-4-dehydrorhamnose reductase [Candidatus Eisenbacteria bacterium]
MRIAVTGAAGMLAKALLPQLESAKHELLALSRDQADVTSFPALRAAIEPFKPEWVIHLAAFTRVDECEREAELAFRVNGLGARNAALVAAACGAAVLTISTDYVFDGRGKRPYREYDHVGPLSVYGKSKWAGEEAVRDASHRHVIVRTAWLYGAGGANFVDSILRKARHGESLAVVDDQRGSPTWTNDLARALVGLVSASEFGTYHCTNGGECTWHELAEHVIRRAGHDGPVERTTTAALARPAPRPAYSVLDGSWCEHVTGHRMPHWKDAVDRYLGTVLAGN